MAANQGPRVDTEDIAEFIDRKADKVWFCRYFGRSITCSASRKAVDSLLLRAIKPNPRSILFRVVDRSRIGRLAGLLSL